MSIYAIWQEKLTAGSVWERSFLQSNLSETLQKVKRGDARIRRPSSTTHEADCCQFPQDMVHYMRKLGASNPIVQ
jgi:hypothetical protein